MRRFGGFSGFSQEVEVRGLKLSNGIEIRFKKPKRTKIMFDESGNKKFAKVFGETFIIHDYLL